LNITEAGMDLVAAVEVKVVVIDTTAYNCYRIVLNLKAMLKGSPFRHSFCNILNRLFLYII
jgi:hypothetical protein